MVDVNASVVRASNDLGGVLVKALGLPQNIIKLSMSFEAGKSAHIECECVVVPGESAVGAIALELQRFEVRLKEANAGGASGNSISMEPRGDVDECTAPVALATRAAPQAGRFQRFLGAVGELLIAFIGRK